MTSVTMSSSTNVKMISSRSFISLALCQYHVKLNVTNLVMKKICQSEILFRSLRNCDASLLEGHSIYVNAQLIACYAQLSQFRIVKDAFVEGYSFYGLSAPSNIDYNGGVPSRQVQ